MSLPPARRALRTVLFLGDEHLVAVGTLGPAYDVHVAATEGATAADLPSQLRGIPTELCERADALVISVGTSDAQRVTPAEFRVALATAVGLCATYSPQAKRVVLGPGEAPAAAHAAVAAQVAWDTGATFVDAAALRAAGGDALLVDVLRRAAYVR